MKENPSRTGSVLIILSGIFWGSMGIFSRHLGSYGFDPAQVVTLRLSVAAVVFALILLLREPKGFRIRLRDLPIFLCLAYVSVLVFTVCYFTAIDMMSLSTAAILLYTSPIWVMLFSVLFFKEKLSRVKLLALALAFGGCVLVSGIGGGGLRFTGLLVGLGAGIGYGLYSIFGTVALRRYSPFVVTTYTFLLAAAGAWLICRPGELVRIAAAAPSLPALTGFVLLTGLITAVIPFLCYTLGLQRVEASRAAILATVEPMVATLFGMTVFHEPVSLSSGLGILLILAAIVLLNRKPAE